MKTRQSTKMKRPALGSGKRFASLKKKLAAKGATSPGALAAWIGTRKWSRKRMTTLAVAGRRRVAK